MLPSTSDSILFEALDHERIFYYFLNRTWDFLKPQGLSPLLEVVEHHAEFVYGLDFSNFIPGLIADCAWDETVKIYKPHSLNVLQTL